MLDGDLLYNNQKLTSEKMSDIIGFVMQSDIFLEYLTVQQTLDFISTIRSKPTDGNNVKNNTSRSNQIIKNLNLTDCKDTRVGSYNVKGISGGERKRLNIAFE